MIGRRLLSRVRRRRRKHIDSGNDRDLCILQNLDAHSIWGRSRAKALFVYRRQVVCLSSTTRPSAELLTS